MSQPNVVANQNAELTSPVEKRSQNLNQCPMVTGGTIGWRTRRSMDSFSLVVGSVLCLCGGGGDFMRVGKV